MSPEVSVLIVSYNTRELTVHAVESLLANTRAPLEVIVVDNGSTDGSVEALRALGDRIRFVVAEENLGFAAGNNLAAGMATAPMLLLLNPDTVVLPGAVDRLLEFARRSPERGVWGGRTLFPDGTLNPSSCWRRITLWSVVCEAAGLRSFWKNVPVCNPEAYPGWERDTEREVDIVSGCWFLIERALWDRLKGFDPEFFMYGEEADLCLRARALGAKPAITPEATIIHYGGASERARLGKLRRIVAARCLLIRRYFPPGVRGLALGIVAMGVGVRAAGSLVPLPRFRTLGSGYRQLWAYRREWLRGRIATEVAS